MGRGIAAVGVGVGFAVAGCGEKPSVSVQHPTTGEKVTATAYYDNGTYADRNTFSLGVESIRGMGPDDFLSLCQAAGYQSVGMHVAVRGSGITEPSRPMAVRIDDLVIPSNKTEATVHCYSANSPSSGLVYPPNPAQ